MRIEKIKSEILDRLTEKISLGVLKAVAAKYGKVEDVELNEIRLRAGKPLSVTIHGREFFVGQAGFVLKPKEAYLPAAEEITDIFARICRNSPYAFSEDIKNGFVTLEGGHRVGIAGKVLQNGSIRDISALNIRVSEEIKGCARKVISHVIRDKSDIFNTLIISPPGAGKTTLIRDMARMLSDGNPSGDFCGVNIGIIDERSEIAACSGGIPMHDVGIRTDVYDGCGKQQGIFMMLRSMAPKIIVTDEIGGEGDFAAIEAAMNSGVRIIATAHGCSVEDIKAKRSVAHMIREGFFEKYIVLSSVNGPGTVEEMC